MLLLLAAIAFSAAAGRTLCDKAREEWAQVGSALQAGQMIDSPDATPAQNANARRRFRILKDTVRQCNSPDGRYRTVYSGVVPRRPSAAAPAAPAQVPGDGGVLDLSVFDEHDGVTQ
jgi:hypothetical protein